MSQFGLFVLGCAVFAVTLVGTFILGFTQFERWAHEDATPVTVDRVP